EPLARAGPDHRLADDRRGRADHARNLPDALDLRPVVGDAAGLPDVDVRAGAENPVPQLSLQPRHQRQRDDERGDPHRHAERRDQGDDGDERLAPPGEQVPEGDVQLERHRRYRAYSLPHPPPPYGLRRMWGKRMTSRIDWLFVSTITSRSMPMPSPPVGGSPYCSARM